MFQYGQDKVYRPKKLPVVVSLLMLTLTHMLAGVDKPGQVTTITNDYLNLLLACRGGVGVTYVTEAGVDKTGQITTLTNDYLSLLSAGEEGG